MKENMRTATDKNQSCRTCKHGKIVEQAPVVYDAPYLKCLKHGGWLYLADAGEWVCDSWEQSETKQTAFETSKTAPPNGSYTIVDLIAFLTQDTKENAARQYDNWIAGLMDVAKAFENLHNSLKQDSAYSKTLKSKNVTEDIEGDEHV